MACNYSPKFISLLASKSETMSELEFKNWVTTYFNDGELVYTRFMNGALFREGGTINPSSKQSTNSNWGRFTYDQEAHTFADYYRGADDLRLKAEQDFKTEIVRRLIFDFKEENPELRWKDSAGSVNTVIAKYKEGLANALLKECGKDPITLTEDLSNDEYTKRIETALTEYRQFLSTNPTTVENYDKFVILSIFDTLLESYADFVSPKPEFINPKTRKAIKTDGFNKYEYKGPNVQHYTGFTSSEFAAIENQDSNLAKILLDVIPEINSDRSPIPNSFIGLSGFNAPMTAVKNWVLFEAPTEIRDEYNKGAKADIGKIIEAYINWTSAVNKDVTSYYDNRRTFLISKLRSIQHYLFGANTDPAIKAMFAGMFFKTENVSYRVYDYDDSLGRIGGRNLKSSFINSQKFSFEDKISGVSYLVHTNSTQRDNIKAKYKLSNIRGSVRIQNINDPAEYIDVCLYKKDNAAEGTINGSYSDKFMKDVIKDFLMFVLPDTYEQVGRATENADWRWEQDFAPFIALIAYDVNGQTITAVNRKKGSIPDLKPLNKATLRVAQKLSTIYGSETRNVVKNPSGNNLPVYQLTNLTYNIQSVIDDILKDESHSFENGVSSQNLLVEARQLLISPQVRNQVSINGKTKDAASLSIKELLELGVFHDFYGAFLNKDSNTEYGKIYLQSATYADKGTHYLVGYDLNKTITTSLGDINLFDVIQNAIKTGDSSQLFEITRHFRANRINAAVQHLLNDYNFVYKDQHFSSLDQLDEFLKTKKYKDVVKDFETVNINFIDEFHGYKPRNNSLGNIRVNETIKSQYETFNDADKFKQRLNKARQAFIQNIEENRWKWNRYDNPLIDQIYGNKAYKDFQGKNGEVLTHIGDRLHPILEAYFMSDVLLSNEYNSIAIGEVYYHPNKNSTLGNENPDEGEVGTYEEFSEANRLIAQIKRSVAFGATYHPYIQGLDNGVTSNIQVAVMNDIAGIVFTPNGDEKTDLDSSDGSGLAHPLQARFENNSLLDARVGMNKKSIMMSLDPRTGKPTLLKWAVYALNNEVRRNGYFAKASTELLYKKMSNGTLDHISTSDLNYLIKRYEGGLMYKDFTTGITYRVTHIEDTETGYRQYRVIVKSDGSTEAADDKIFTKGTLYDLDQLFGGCWTGSYKNGQWVYNEANLDLLEKLFVAARKKAVVDTRYTTTLNQLDHSFIAYAVNKSAIKVGAEGINPSERFSNDEPLRTFTMSTKYGGVQMNADHELDLAEVTEMTQMISALTEDGHYKDIVESIYQDIGETVAAHMAKLNTAVEDVIKTGTEKSKRELYRVLADSWIRSFENSNKDTIGIAQAFVKRASEAFRNGNFDFRVPFSAATINGSFISDVVSSINRGGIRHKYEGFAGVLNPSHDMIMYYRVWNENTGKWETRMFDQFADFARGSFTPKTFNAQTVNSVLVNGQFNPLCKESNYNDINFEDTVVITKTTADGLEVLVHDIYPDGGDPDAIYLNSFTAYDTVKRYLRNNAGCKVYIHTGRPRNLAAGNVRFKVDNRWYSIYDLDSVRCSQYLTKALNKASKAKSGNIEQFLSKEQLATLKQTLGYNYTRLIADDSNRNEIYNRVMSLIKKLNAKTETTLKNIEKGDRIDNSEAFITRRLERLDIDGNIINLNSFQAALALMGPKKQVDTQSAIELIQENVEDATDYNPVTHSSLIANWLISILQDPTVLSEETLPIGLNATARQKVAEVLYTNQEFDRLSRKQREFPDEVKVSTLAEAYNAVQDAWTDLYDYIADEHLTGLHFEHIVRKIARNEQTVPWDTSVTTTDYVVDAPEIIMGRYQGEKFGIGENDHIYQISDYHYFEDKLYSKYSLPDYTESELFDAILYGNNEQFLIKIGELPEELSGRISESTDFTEIDGDIYYEGTRIGSNQNKRFFTYLDNTGGKHHVILVNNADTFREIRRSALFDDVIRYNWTDENFDVLKNVKFGNRDRFRIYYDSEHTTEVSLDELTLGEAQVDETIRLDKRIRNQAQDMYESFEKQLNYVGARIPTQAMQSFMPMRTIAWVNTLTNMVYVPKIQTYLEGSDYDIDKLYILAYSVNSNGLVQTGSSLQSKYGLNFVTSLSRPNGITYQVVESPEGAFTISADTLLRFNEDTLSNEETAALYNQIYKESNGNIYFEPTPTINVRTRNRVINKILNEINGHAGSVLERNSDPNYLKNRIVSAIYDLTTKLQNQMIAQIPVDMGDPQEAAKNSTLGRAEMHINSDNPATKFMMQVQNMIGKEVIGISAVSLKAFFGLYYYYSTLNQNLKDACTYSNPETDADTIIEALDKLLIIHPLTGEITSLANIDIEQVQEVIANDNRFRHLRVNPIVQHKFDGSKWYKNGELNLIGFLKDLQVSVNKIDAALTDSAVISAATDNAKELILAKINATPELVDIYTYLTTIGTPFMDIANIMTSPAFGFILKAVESNIFDEGTGSYKAKTGIDWFLDKKLLPGVDTDLLKQLLPGIPEYSDIPKLLTLDNIENALNQLYAYLEHPVVLDDPNTADAIRAQLDDQGKSVNRLFGYEYIPKSDVRNVIKYLELERDKQTYKASLSEDEIKKIESISEIIPAIEEMTIMGGAQGINQGQRTNLFDNRSFIKRLENFINKTIDAKTPDEDKKKPDYKPSDFNFRTFIADENYRTYWINHYDGFKYTYNILDALTTLPHFWEMLKTTYASKNAITLSSWKSNTIWSMADIIEKESSSSYLSQDDWRAGESYLNDYIIASFLASSNIEIEIPMGAKYYSGLGIKGLLENKVDGYKIKLNSISNIATFKKIMDDYIIPSLFRNLDFAGNKFIDNLMPMASVSGDKVLTGWKLPLNMMLIDASPNTKLLWADILNGFDQIANQTVPGVNMKLGDLFYLYNLIVNKDTFGQSSFTRLFENQVNTNNEEALPNKFNEFISRLDKGDINLPITPTMLDEMKYRIKKANPNSNIKSPISKWLDLPSDYTLDLPKFFQLPVTRERGYETVQETSSHNIGTSDTDGLFALVQNLAQMYSGENQPAVNLITDDDLIGLPTAAKNAKAFILDGNVYFNVNSAHMSDGLHELSHLVLAAMKFSDNPEIRQQYYTLVGKMKDRNVVSEERFNSIVDKYKNGEEDILITSDILEEVLANEFAFWLEGEIFENNPFLTIDSEKNVLKAIQNMLNIDKDLQLKDIEGKTLNEILQAFGKELLNTTAIDSQFILRSQRVGAKKVQLYKDEKLKCK